MYKENLSHCVCSASPEQLTFLTNGPRCPEDLESCPPNHCMKMVSFLPNYEAYKDTFLDIAHSFQELRLIYFFSLCLTWKSSLLLTEGPIKSQSILLHSYIMTKAVSVDLGSGAIPSTLHLLVYTYLILLTYV